MKRVELICGAPCSGKSTLATDLAFSQVGRLIDRDEIARNIAGGDPMWLYPPDVSDRAELIFRQSIRDVAHAHEGTFIIVRSLPEWSQRVKMAKWLKATVTICDPGIDVCLERARSDNRPHGTEKLIHDWYRRHDRGDSERIYSGVQRSAVTPE